jgi:hypothetical protein
MAVRIAWSGSSGDSPSISMGEPAYGGKERTRIGVIEANKRRTRKRKLNFCTVLGK